MTDNADRIAIDDLLHRYADAVCCNDADQWASCWTEDGIWDLGGDRRVEGRDTVVQAWLAAMSRFEQGIQVVLNSAYEIDGDTAKGRCYIMEYLNTGDFKMQMIGYYDDELARTPDGWCFTLRELQSVYRGPGDLSGEWISP